MNVRTNFLNWRPDQDEFNADGLLTADNILHDTEGYNPLVMQTASAFATATWYSGATLSSVRSMQIRTVGGGGTRVGAIAQDKATTAAIAELSIGVEGEASAFTTVSTATLASAGGVRTKAFSVGELESGAFLVCAAFDASLLSGGSTIYSITGEVTYTVSAESEGTPGSGTTSLEGTNANHSRSGYNSDIYAGIYLKNDGVEYASGADGTAEGSTLTSWLDTGSVDGIWTRCTLDSGSLDIDAGTDLWLSNSTSRHWAAKSTSATATSVVTLETATDSSGTNIVDTATYTLTAVRNATSLAGTQPEHSNSASLEVYAGVYLKNDGVEYAIDETGTLEGTSLGNYVDVGAVADLWVRCTLHSGTLDGGNSGTGTWLACTSSRTWGIERLSGKGADTANLTLELATDSGGANIIDTAYYSLSAFRTSF